MNDKHEELILSYMVQVVVLNVPNVKILGAVVPEKSLTNFLCITLA